MIFNWDEMIWERCNYFRRLIRSDPGVGVVRTEVRMEMVPVDFRGRCKYASFGNFYEIW